MDRLTFIAEIIQAVAWPLVVLVVFLSLRKPLLELLPSLRSFRYRDLELGFDTQVQALANDIRRLLPEARLSGEAVQQRQSMEELARLSPRAVVLESWLQLERTAMDVSRRKGLDLDSRQIRTPILLGHALEQAGILDDEMQTVFYRLRNLRNAAAHASDFAFDAESAMEYADLALRLNDYLQNA
jgi:hypothetical protein